jgi:hypothetical protein
MITLADLARTTLLGTSHPRLVQAATRCLLARPTDQRHNVHSNHKWRKQGASPLAANRQPFWTTDPGLSIRTSRLPQQLVNVGSVIDK